MCCLQIEYGDSAMTYLKILIYALATFMATSTPVFADDDEDDEIPFEEGWLFSALKYSQ